MFISMYTLIDYTTNMEEINMTQENLLGAMYQKADNFQHSVKVGNTILRWNDIGTAHLDGW